MIPELVGIPIARPLFVISEHLTHKTVDVHHQPLIAWAGYDHLQLAKAIADHYVQVKEQEGGRDDPRLTPLLAGLIELLPWLKQWHNEIDPEFGVAMGDFYQDFAQAEAREMGRTMEEVRGWQPPARKAARKPRSKKGE